MSEIETAHIINEIVERAYWTFLAKQDHTQTQTPDSERDAYKHSVFAAIAEVADVVRLGRAIDGQEEG